MVCSELPNLEMVILSFALTFLMSLHLPSLSSASGSEDSFVTLTIPWQEELHKECLLVSSHLQGGYKVQGGASRDDATSSSVSVAKGGRYHHHNLYEFKNPSLESVLIHLFTSTSALQSFLPSSYHPPFSQHKPGQVVAWDQTWWDPFPRLSQRRCRRPGSPCRWPTARPPPCSSGSLSIPKVTLPPFGTWKSRIVMTLISFTHLHIFFGQTWLNSEREYKEKGSHFVWIWQVAGR